MAGTTMTPAELEYQMAHITEDRSDNIIAAISICLGLAVIAVGLRFYARRLMRTKLGADDWMMLVALFFNIVYATSNFILVHFGLGKHIITLKDPVATVKAEIATLALYNPAMIFVKFSILLLYHRLFPSRKFRAVLLGVAAFVLAYTLAGTFVVIFHCVPVRSNWDPTVKGRCVNLTAELIALGVLNSLSDVVILALPLPFVWRLQSSIAHKVQLTGVFLLGGFVCITSIVRVIVVADISLKDGTWVNTYPAIWAFVETSIAVVSACLVTLRPVYRYIIYGSSGLSQVSKTSKPSAGSASQDSKGIKMTKSVSSWSQNAGSVPAQAQTARQDRFGRLPSLEKGESRQHLPNAQIF